MRSPPSLSPSPGFTLVEILVGLTIVTIIGAMIASTTKQSILSSRALLHQGHSAAQKTVLRRILHRDIHNMLLDSSMEPTKRGFRFTSGHNLLIRSSLPVNIAWNFTQGELLRREEIPDLDYSQEQVLCPDLDSFELEFMPAGDIRWVGLEAWLLNKQRPAPAAVRLLLRVSGRSTWEIIERIPRRER